VSPEHPEYPPTLTRHLPPDQGGCKGAPTTLLRAGWHTVGPMSAEDLVDRRPCQRCLRNRMT
jgi:hypothetical protein